MRLLHVVSTVDPSHGGVAESILRRGLRLIELGHEVEVVSLDAPDAQFVKAYPLPIHALGPAWSAWCYAPALRPWLAAQARRFDCVVVDGLWQYHTVATRRALLGSGVPYVVLPHGMLNPWFKRQYPLRHLKKWLVWPWADYRVLRDAAAVLYTCEEERSLARQMFSLYSAEERVVSFGTAPPPADTQASRDAFETAFPALRGKRYLLFLGRLHPKKGCDLLLHAFADGAAEVPALQLVFAGPGASRFQATLRAIAAKRGISDRVHWLGMLDGAVKWGSLACCEAFVLPSHQENFGIAVVEALASGKPVLISDKVNIHGEITASGCGLVDIDTAEGTAALIQRWLSLTDAARNQLELQALETYRKRFSIDSMAQGLVEAVRGLSP